MVAMHQNARIDISFASWPLLTSFLIYWLSRFWDSFEAALEVSGIDVVQSGATINIKKKVDQVME